MNIVIESISAPHGQYPGKVDVYFHLEGGNLKPGQTDGHERRRICLSDKCVRDDGTYDDEQIASEVLEKIRQSTPDCMTKYTCTDGQGSEIEISAESPREAAQKYVDGGDWGTIKETTWVSVRVTEIEDPDNSDMIKVSIDPEEPDCRDRGHHDWCSPHSVLGGLKENPGVWGSGGGVKITKVCRHCGCYRLTNTWAQDPEDGEQGLVSVKYADADSDSLAWVMEQAREAIEAAIEVAGLHSGNLSDDMTIAIPDEPDTETALEIKETIEKHLPEHIQCDWTGSSDTNGDGETTSDLQFSIK